MIIASSILNNRVNQKYVIIERTPKANAVRIIVTGQAINDTYSFTITKEVTFFKDTTCSSVSRRQTDFFHIQIIYPYPKEEN